LQITYAKARDFGLSAAMGYTFGLNNIVDGNDEMVIPLNKKKIMLAIFSVLTFILRLGIWMSSLDPFFIQQFRRFNNPHFVHTVGLVFFLMGSLFVLYEIKVLFSNRVLIFNSNGIVDYINRVGFIPWCEIENAMIINMYSQQLFAIALKKPHKFLGKSWFRRTLLRSYNTPVVFSISNLNVRSSNELLEYFDQYQKKYSHA
jgi:hypothetical protein